MKNILLVIDGFGHGGIQQAYKILIKEFSKNFNRVFLIIIESGMYELDIEMEKNLTVVRLKSKKLFDIKTMYRFKKIIDKIQPSIIISSIYKSQIWSAYVKPKTSKLIWIEHNTYYQRTKLQWNLMKVLSRRVDKIVGVSSNVSDFTESKLNKIVVTIPNPFTHNSAFTITSQRKKDFIFVARLTLQKNPELMILSFAEFVRTYDSSSRLHIVGGGVMLKSLKFMANELKLRDNCIFHGFVSISKVQELMQNSKTLISTSRFEGMALVRLEALANGCCVVSTNTGGTDLFDSVRNYGFFVVDSDAKNIAKAMFESLESRYWSEENIGARKAIVKHFQPSVIASKLIEFN
jgi:glycosyltransferase involved in cell wall biosynthesis